MSRFTWIPDITVGRHTDPMLLRSHIDACGMGLNKGHVLGRGFGLLASGGHRYLQSGRQVGERKGKQGFFCTRIQSVEARCELRYCFILREPMRSVEETLTQSWDSLSQLVQSELGMRFTVRRGKDRHQLPENSAAAVHKTFLCAFSCGHGLLCLSRDIAGLLEETPTPGP